MDLSIDQHKIIDAAFKRFAKTGPENTTMAQIAKDLGYSRTFLYYYFQDKESIYKAALLRRSNRYFESVQKEMTKNLPGFKKLEGMIKMKIGCGKDFQSLGVYTNMDLFKILVHDDDLKKIYSNEIKLAGKIINDGIKDGSIINCNANKTARNLIDGMHGFAAEGLRRLHVNPNTTEKDIADLYKRKHDFGMFLLQGIKKG